MVEIPSKHELRRQCRQVRRLLGAEARARASQQICEHLAGWHVFREAETVGAYLPMKEEVDLRPLLEHFPAKRWVLPRIREERQMDFHAYDPAQLVVHPFGMLEPAANLPIVPAADIALLLVPGLAYDRQGWRLGYGGGYYDRFLAAFGGISAGVAFHALLLDSLPHESHDAPVGWVVTEQGLFAAR